MVKMVARLAAAVLLAVALPLAAQDVALPLAAKGPALAAAPLAELVRKVDIPYEQFTLPNGLRVVVHTDRKAPLVSVGVWYHVGSKDEPVGQAGYAHLFEHLMFYGSQHNQQEHFKPLEAIGATDFNGTTSFDRTNYFQTVPTPALPLALFLESDRMGWLLPALTQDKLDAQRGVVFNEKKQGENQPYGMLFPALLAGLYPADHPYSGSSIGRVEDLEKATLADARAWFAANYGPNNTVLVLAGDIDATTARPMVEAAFGQIPAGPTPARFAAPVPRREATTRAVIRDKVATARLVRGWAIPGQNDADSVNLSIALATLAGGATSLLHEALVRDERLAVAVSGGTLALEEGGIANLMVDVRPGVDPAAVEARIDALLAGWLRAGPNADDVARVAMRAASGTIRGLEKVGGFGGKGVALAEGALYAGDPGDYARELAAYAAATPETVRAAANRWLAKGDHRIAVVPGEREALAKPASEREALAKPASEREVLAKPASEREAEAGLPTPLPRTIARAAVPAVASAPVGVPIDRTRGLPAVGEATRLVLPPIERATLSNGMKVVFAPSRSVPLVRLLLSFDAGVAGDDRRKPGTQGIMLAMLDEGSNGALGPMSGPQVAREMERLGASFSAAAGLDRTRLGLNVLAPNLAPSLALFADMVRTPAFDSAQLERIRVQALTALAAEATSPQGLAYRALPELLYGPEHPYGLSFSGSGTEAGLKAITQADLQAFHATLRPEEATLFVVGDTSMADILPLLETHLGGWTSKAPAVAKAESATMPPARPERIVFIDRPGAPQSLIVAGAVSPLSGRDDTLALTLANEVFGGGVTSRLNQDLRETKAWSYGASSGFSATARAMPFQLSAPVQSDRTGDSIAAIRALLQAYRGAAPPTQEEIDRARAGIIRSLPGDFETGGALLGSLERNLALGRPDDHVATLPARLAAIPAAAVAAAPVPAPDQLVWVVVGDRASVLPQLQKLGLPIEERPATGPMPAAPPGAAAPGRAPRQ